MATSLQRIEEYEELFKNRYTELDDDYRETIRKGQRLMVDVPVMNPWPPPKPYSSRGRGRYSDWNRNRRHRGGYGRGYFRGGSRQFDTYQQRQYGDYGGKTPNDHDSYKDYSKSYKQDFEWKSEEPPDNTSTDQPVVPCLEDTKEQHECGSSERTEHKYDDHSQKLVDTFDSPNTALAPTESDFLAILSTASSSTNTLQSKNLKKEKMRKAVSKNSKQNVAAENQPYLHSGNTGSLSSKVKTNPKTGEGVLVSHGLPESVTASILLSGLESSKKSDGTDIPSAKKRKWMEEENSGSEQEHIDVEGDGNPQEYSLLLQGSSNSVPAVKQPFYQGRKEDSLMVKYPLGSFDGSKIQTDSKLADTVNEITETDHPLESKVTRKKKSKKRKKHHQSRKEEEPDKGNNGEQSLTLRIKRNYTD